MGIYVYQDKISSTEKKLKNFNFDWKDKRVLELGANVGKLGLYVLEKGAKEYKGIELDKNMVDIGIKRYGLDLVCMDVSELKDSDYDVAIALALFHHFSDEKLKALLPKITSEELIFEVPVGTNDVSLYHTRTEQEYREMIESLYGNVIEIVDSGATNDPYNRRVIFYCKKKC